MQVGQSINKKNVCVFEVCAMIASGIELYQENLRAVI